MASQLGSPGASTGRTTTAGARLRCFNSECRAEYPITEVIYNCPRCGGLVKPSVVFFGEPLPAHVVQRAFDVVEEADALLVVGSSLTVWS